MSEDGGRTQRRGGGCSLAEATFLLGWDAQDGSPLGACQTTLRFGVGGALLVDAIRAEVVEVRDGRVNVVPGASAHGAIAEVVRSVEDRRRPPKVQAAVERLGSSRTMGVIRDGLLSRGILREDRRRFLGLVPYTRYPVVDPTVSDQLRDDVRRVLVDPDPLEDVEGDDAVLLAGLAAPLHLVQELVPREQRKEAERRSAAIASGDAIPEAVKESIENVYLAITATVVTAITASNAATTSTHQ